MLLDRYMREHRISDEMVAGALGVRTAKVALWRLGIARIHPHYLPRLREFLGLRGEVWIEMRRELRSVVTSSKPVRLGKRYDAHVGFVCTKTQKYEIQILANQLRISPSALLRRAVEDLVQTLMKSGADAGIPQGPGRKISSRTRQTPTRLPQSPEKAQACPAVTVKSLRPRRPFSKTKHPKNTKEV